MIALSLAWRQLRSHWTSGEVRILLLALVLAVSATTAVGFFTDRIQSALVRQGGSLLGGDLVVSADHALPQKYLLEAQQLKLQSTSTLAFPSMIAQGKLSQLAEIKAVNDGFPLRGKLAISTRADANQIISVGSTTNRIPIPGPVWIE